MKQPEVYVDGILYKAHRMAWSEEGKVWLFTVKIKHESVNIFAPDTVTPYWHDKDDEGYKIEFPKEAKV